MQQSHTELWTTESFGLLCLPWSLTLILQGSLAGEGALAQEQGMMSSRNPAAAKFMAFKLLSGDVLLSGEKE